MSKKTNKNLLKEHRLVNEHKEWERKPKNVRLEILTNKILNSDSYRKCNDFIDHLSDELGIKIKMDYSGLYYKRHNGKREKEIYEMTLVYTYETDKFIVIFKPLNNNSIELFEFRVFPEHQNQGVGTSVLNDILDVSDLSRIRLSIYPSVSSNKLSKKERTTKHFNLKEWFKSFGFTNQKFGSNMIYEPQKNSLKMTG